MDTPGGTGGGAGGGARETVFSPAKVNLFLRVVGRRPDGYHDLETLMCPLSFGDTVEIEPGGRDLQVHCASPDVPDGEGNIAWRAASAYFHAAGLSGGVTVRIEKRIPVGAGLGGGSGNAAAVLTGLDRLHGGVLGAERLREIALSLGADVPFFIGARPCLARGVGEVLTPVAGLYSHHVVVVFPNVAVSTALVYKNLNLALTRCRKIHRLPEFKWEPSATEELLCNDLETVTLPLFPVIGEVKGALLRAGARGALMSGSGSAVFGLFRDENEARRARFELEARGRWRVFEARLMV